MSSDSWLQNDFLLAILARSVKFFAGRSVPTAPSATADTNGGLGTARPTTATSSRRTNARSRVRRDAVLRKPRSTIDFKRVGSSFDTILNYGPAHTRTYLAISRSQSLTGLSCTNTTAGRDLNLTRSSEAGSGDNRSAVVFRTLKIQELTTSS